MSAKVQWYICKLCGRCVPGESIDKLAGLKHIAEFHPERLSEIGVITECPWCLVPTVEARDLFYEVLGRRETRFRYCPKCYRYLGNYAPEEMCEKEGK